MARGRDRRSRCVGSRAAIPGTPADSTRFPESSGIMMETQRIIALIVFSISALFLWEAWEKHNAPIPVSAPAMTASPSTAATVPSTPGAATLPPAQGSVSPAPPVSQTATSALPPIHITTDLLDVEIDPVGGDIHRLTLRQVHSAKDRAKPLTLLEPDPQHFFIAQSGLLGEGLPNHNTVYEAEQRSYELAPGRDTLEVRLHARDAGGNDVVKRYVFHRGKYLFDLAYDVTNRSAKPLPAFAYFQFLRDGNPPSQEATQTSSFGGVTTFTGPAVYTAQAKYEKISFKDIDKGKTPEPRKAKDGWIAIVQHYFVSAWIPREGEERE